MKSIAREDLIIRPSWSMAFRGSMIWFGEYDRHSVHTDLVRGRFKQDLKEIRRPSTPGLLAINLHETALDGALAQAFAGELARSGPQVRRVAFVGLSWKGRRLLSAALKQQGVAFTWTLLSDLEKAKEWLVS